MAHEQPLRLPDGFRFGVATAGFQVEGGYNGPGEPANNWAAWEREGRVEPSGLAIDLWRRYDEHLDRVVALGCDSVRLSVEWARCQPEPGPPDASALDRYAGLLAAARARRLEPVVELHHFTHPAWLGPDFWLELDAPERFAAWAELAVARLAPLCRRWVTVHQPNLYAFRTYVTGELPPGRRLAGGPLVRSLDHLLAAHLLAAEAVRRRQPEASVALTVAASPVYELDGLLGDVLGAPAAGVARGAVGGHLVARRRAWYDRSGPAPPWAPERGLRRVAATAVPGAQALPRAIAAAYDAFARGVSPAVQLSWSDPAATDRVPARARLAWEAFSVGGGLAGALARRPPGEGLEVVDDGFSSRVVRGRPVPRADGRDRPGHLHRSLDAVARAVAAGVDLRGYWHRTLADAYEWGTYEPRFGLFGIDRDRGLRWSPLDAMGHDAAGAYRRLIAGLRAGAGPDGLGPVGGNDGTRRGAR